MTDTLSLLKSLHRPRLLIRAARFGQEDYCRDRDLTRILRISRPPAPLNAVDRLIEQEQELEEIRTTGDAGYSPARHVEVLIALMAEARALLGLNGPRPA